jgi:hypothetical protein
MFALMSVVFALIYGISFYLVEYLYGEWTEADRLKYTHFEIVAMISAVFTITQSIQMAHLYANSKFIKCEIIMFISTLLVTFGVSTLIDLFNGYGAVCAVAIRSIIISVAFMFTMGSYGNVIKDLYQFRIIIRRIMPIVRGAFYFKTDILVDRVLIGGGVTGSLTLFYLSQQIFSGFHQLLSKVIANPFLLDILSLRKSNFLSREIKTRLRSIVIAVTLFLLFSLFIFIISSDILFDLMLDVNKYSTNSRSLLFWVIIASSGVLIGGAVSQILVNTYYAIGDTNTPVNISLVTYTLSVPLKIWAYQVGGVLGVAIVSSLYYVTDTILQYVFILKRV